MEKHLNISGLEAQIETLLAKKEFKSRNDMRLYLKNIHLLINKYELELYQSHDEKAQNKVNDYREMANKIFLLNKNIKSDEKESQETYKEEGIETLKMLNTQLMLADINQKQLEKGTIKIESLDYTNTDILREIQKANTKIKTLKDKERGEVSQIKRAYKFLLLICLLILCDKIYIRFIRPSINLYRRFKPINNDETGANSLHDAEREEL
ncbi:hypothetical protein ECANGB1_533 [Enterospora canceri]|uniref:Uncharacterized protein n=1 Tax=Enterospora canceri TaxID=1081671 RepID=A0A1Y1S8M9_9MICR|nr:hypothetical protein ECANGB1_533 [Enterospora canceri]